MATKPDPEENPVATGHLQVTGPGPLVVLGLIGLVCGWGLRWLTFGDGPSSPRVGFPMILVTWFIASVTLGTAFLTRRTVLRNPRELTAHQGLIRLVGGKSVARLAAFGLGAFVGIAISRIGVVSANADEVIIKALVAALGAAAGLAGGLWLEHACRVPPSADPDLP